MSGNRIVINLSRLEFQEVIYLSNGNVQVYCLDEDDDDVFLEVEPGDDGRTFHKVAEVLKGHN